MVTRLIAFLLALGGCAGTDAHALVQPRLEHGFAAFMLSDAQCQRLLSHRRTFGALGAGAAFAGGSGGIATAFPADGNARYAVGAAALSMGITGAVLMYLSNASSEDFNRYCSTSPTR